MVNAPNVFQPRVGIAPRRCPVQRQCCAIPSIRQCSSLTVPSLPHITASFPAITHQGLIPLKQCIRPRGRTYLLKALRSILTTRPPRVLAPLGAVTRRRYHSIPRAAGRGTQSTIPRKLFASSCNNYSPPSKIYSGASKQVVVVHSIGAPSSVEKCRAFFLYMKVFPIFYGAVVET